MSAISHRTVRSCLVEAGFNYSRLSSKPLLAEKQQHYQLKWAKSTKSYDRNEIIISDEITIRLSSVKNIFGTYPKNGKWFER